MKTSISWNDMNDSSELSAGSSDEEVANIIKSKKQNEEPPSLQKAVSSPEQISKPQKFDNNAKITENLEKLNKHTDSYVWLYLSDFPTNRQDTVKQILESVKDFQKILNIGKSWNVQLKTELASKYIQKSLYQRGINLRFIYSNKNESSQPKKYEKKYSQKNRNGYDDYQQIRSPRIKQKSTFSQKTNYQKDKQYAEGGQKKKVKYVAKEIRKQDDNKVNAPINIKQETQQQTSSVQKREIGSKANGKSKFQQKQTNLNENNQNNLLNTQKRQSQQEYAEKREENSDDQQQVSSKAQKDKKKKKKKDKNSRGGFKDPNNPFSSFG